MDSIPWEKAQLAAEEKPLRYGKRKALGLHLGHKDGDLKNIALRAG